MLAALAGSAVVRLFLGGPLDGQLRTVNPDSGVVYAQVPPPPIDIRQWLAQGEPVETEAVASKTVVYVPKRFAIRGVGWRAVMVTPDVADPDRALMQWLARQWVEAAPEGTW